MENTMDDVRPLHDEDIREPLYFFLEERYGKVRIIEEKVMGRSRADALMVTEWGVCGIEIKSDADTYARLTSQVKDYDRYWDKNYVVVGKSHEKHIAEHVPDTWGLIVAEDLHPGVRDGRLHFEVVREAKDNPKREMGKKLSMMWRRELDHLLALNALPKYQDKGKKYVEAVLISRVPEGRLQRQVSEELFERDYTTIKEDLRERRQQKKKTRAARGRR